MRKPAGTNVNNQETNTTPCSPRQSQKNVAHNTVHKKNVATQPCGKGLCPNVKREGECKCNAKLSTRRHTHTHTHV